MSEGLLGGNVRALGLASFTFNPAAVAAATSAEQTVTVPGARVGDFVFLSKPTATAGVGIVNARVSAADTIAVTFVNATAGSIDPASETYTVMWVRASGNLPGAIGD